MSARVYARNESGPLSREMMIKRRREGGEGRLKGMLTAAMARARKRRKIKRRKMRKPGPHEIGHGVGRRDVSGLETEGGGVHHQVQRKRKNSSLVDQGAQMMTQTL